MNTPAREGLPELPGRYIRSDTHVYPHGEYVYTHGVTEAHGHACYDAGYRAALAAIAGREAQGGKFVGWFMTANAEGTLAFLNSLADPREVHDNGKPYYRAYAALPHPQPARGEAVNDWKQWADLERYVEEARESFLGHPSSGIFRAIGKKLSAMTTPPPPSDAAQGDKEFAEHMDTLEYVERVFRDEGSSRMAESVVRAARFFVSLRAHKGEGNG